MTIPERIRIAARLACEPARTELRKIAEELEREEKNMLVRFSPTPTTR